MNFIRVRELYAVADYFSVVVEYMLALRCRSIEKSISTTSSRFGLFNSTFLIIVGLNQRNIIIATSIIHRNVAFFVKW